MLKMGPSLLIYPHLAEEQTFKRQPRYDVVVGYKVQFNTIHNQAIVILEQSYDISNHDVTKCCTQVYIQTLALIYGCLYVPVCNILESCHIFIIMKSNVHATKARFIESTETTK